MPRVILVTGSGRGLGHAMVQAFLNAGEYVVATTRNAADLSFSETTSSNYLPLKLDVTSSEDIDAAFSAALERFGRIDVVINNAAFGLVGPLETLTDAQIRAQFETNFFSVAAITRRAVQVMRIQQPSGGLIMQISSISTLFGFPMLGAMCASKFALEGLTEAVQAELKPDWGIKLTSVKLDGLNTKAHELSMVYGDVEVPEYDHMDARNWVESLKAMPLLEPVQVAKAIVKLSHMEDIPVNAILGAGVLKMAEEKLRRDEKLLARGDMIDLTHQ